MNRPRPSTNPRFRGDQRRSGPQVRINDDIRVPEIRVVDEEGQMLGIMSPRKAQQLAAERGLDLVEIAPQATPPVCKIIDFGKFRYEQQKREKQQKKSQHQQQLKEIRFNYDTDTHDFEFKTRHARGFLESGHKVKGAVRFHGREIVHRSIGIELLERFVAALEDVSKVDQTIKVEGMNCTVILSPEKVKKTAKSPKEKSEKQEKPEKQEKQEKPQS